MILTTDRVLIDRPAAAVWAFLEDPANLPRWNPKVKGVRPHGFGRPGPGHRFSATFQMNDRARAVVLEAELVRFEPPVALVIRYTGGPEARGRVFNDAYELSERSGQTLLVETVRAENPGINPFFRLLIWFIRQVGKPVGRPYLDTLRELVEEGG